MDTTDTSPLLLDEVGVASTEEEEEEAREKEWMKDLVQFHGRVSRACDWPLAGRK